jgi:hypothetical protein
VVVEDIFSGWKSGRKSAGFWNLVAAASVAMVVENCSGFYGVNW